MLGFYLVKGAEADAGVVAQYQHWTVKRETALVDKVIC